MQALTHYYLQQMDIEPWCSREATVEPLDLTTLASQAQSCTRCPLHKTRTHVVFSRGNPESGLMIIGEGPGYHEDQQGLPFVGKAGQLLNKMLMSIGLSENDVYITNVIKCRPPNNRDPNPDEIAQCRPFLTEQLSLIQPKLIMGVGRFAGQFLLGQTLPMARMRQLQYQHEGIPCIITYHPAYLLRNPRDKRKAFQDLQRVSMLLAN